MSLRGRSLQPGGSPEAAVHEHGPGHHPHGQRAPTRRRCPGPARPGAGRRTAGRSTSAITMARPRKRTSPAPMSTPSSAKATAPGRSSSPSTTRPATVRLTTAGSALNTRASSGAVPTTTALTPIPTTTDSTSTRSPTRRARPVVARPERLRHQRLRGDGEGVEGQRQQREHGVDDLVRGDGGRVDPGGHRGGDRERRDERHHPHDEVRARPEQPAQLDPVGAMRARGPEVGPHEQQIGARGERPARGRCSRPIRRCRGRGRRRRRARRRGWPARRRPRWPAACAGRPRPGTHRRRPGPRV